MTSLHEFNQRVSAEFRTTGGKLGASGLTSPILLLTTTDAKSGAARIRVG
jgi:hypothetical protein